MVEISNFDAECYKKIRNNIDDFLEQQSKTYDKEGVQILDIAPQIHKGAKEFFVKSCIKTLDINPSPNVDIVMNLCNPYQSIQDKFDIVICTEVLEHTLKPFKAIDTIYNLLNHNGILLMSTPFNFRIHGPLPDCWRFTEHGIRALLENFEIIEIKALEDPDRFLMPLHYTTIARRIG